MPSFFLFATCKFIIFTELFLLNKVNLHFFYNKKNHVKFFWESEPLTIFNSDYMLQRAFMVSIAFY